MLKTDWEGKILSLFRVEIRQVPVACCLTKLLYSCRFLSFMDTMSQDFPAPAVGRAQQKYR